MAIQDFNMTSLDGSNGFQINGESEFDLSGRSVSNAGDVNGDGFDDVIVGAPHAFSSGERTGSSYVVFGKATEFEANTQLSSLDGSNGFRIEGERDHDRSGYSVSNAGDVNGDGFDDVIVGAPYDSIYGERSDYAYVVFGRASGFDASLRLASLDGVNGFRLDGMPGEFSSGLSVGSAGDINGDGLDDIIGNVSGASFIVFGKASGFDANIDLSSLDGSNGFRFDGSLDSTRSSVFFGYSVSGAGDVNGDGLDDVIIGDPAPGDAVFSDIGLGYVVFGRTSGFDAQMDLTDLNGSNGFRLNGVKSDRAGYSVSGAGDINGDGFDDVIIGAPDANGDQSGSSFVVFGKASGFDAQMDLSSLDGQNGFRLNGEAYDRAGASVSSAGDVNGDGFDDLIIAVPEAARANPISGSSYVLFGKGEGFDAEIELSSLDGRTGFRLNGPHSSLYAVSSAGDMNHDGFDDLIVGQNNSSYVILGSPDVTGNLALDMIMGTPEGDDLQGTAANEYLSAGGGDDTLVGGGGADKFDGGEGDDDISLTDLEFAAIDGGAGKDTVQLQGSDIHLDLSQTGMQVYNTEVIDLKGTGNNALTLTASALSKMQDSINSDITIRGDSGDRITVSDPNWIEDGFANDGYHTYQNAGVSMHVQEGIQIDFLEATRLFLDESGLDGSNGFKMFGEKLNDYFGQSVSSAGDINGDGIDDVIIGADGVDVNGDQSGSSYVVFGRASGFDENLNLANLDGTNGFRLDGEQAGDISGRSVSGAGDVNGDGFADMIVGAWGADPNGESSGSSYVVFGRETGFDAQFDLSDLDGSNGFRLNGERTGDRSGYSVSDAGDVNGDGFDDLIIGASGAPDGRNAGSSYVVFGRASGFEADMNLSSLDGSNGFRLNGSIQSFSGQSVSNAGDVNGDGFDDVIIGAVGADANGDRSGSSYVVFGRDSGFDAQIDLFGLNGQNGFRLDGEAAFDRSGASVSSAGDVNGDGLDDLIIGAPSADPQSYFENRGSSYVVFGKTTGFDRHMDLSSLDGSNGFRLDGESKGSSGQGSSLGTSVSSAGDINGDGFDDLIIGTHLGAYRYDRSTYTYVIFGKDSGFDAHIDLFNLKSDEGFRLSNPDHGILGAPVSGAGDINGDGLDDLIVGTDYYYYHNSGASYVIFGSRDFGKGNGGGGGGGELPEINGTDGDDTLKGSETAEHFIAGDGNDSLLGRGGADVFDAGTGDDAIRIGDLTFASIDGGDGNDALHLTGADLNLDLTALGDRIHSIETICLYGRGDNILTLTADSLLNLSDSTDTLKVHGNSGDHIVVQDSGWIDDGSRGFYHSYTHDDAVLLVGTNVTVDFLQG